MPVEKVPDALVRLVGRYLEEHRDGEPFYSWARRRQDHELRGTLVGVSEAVAP